VRHLEVVLMQRPIAILGAASNIGISTYVDGTPRCLDRAPAALRAAGLVERIGAGRDLGDLFPEPYRQFERLPGHVHHEDEVGRFVSSIAEWVAGSVRAGEFPVVLGGDCSIVLGGLLGARLAGIEALGLAYLDGHADFATAAESRSGSAASMCLALAIGRGTGKLTNPGGLGPLVSADAVALVGRRDEDQPWYGQSALPASGVLDLPDATLREDGYASASGLVLEKVATQRDGFWIHLDADVIASDLMPAVDSPAPGGAGLDDLGRLLTELVRHPAAVGLELTIYDPNLDPAGACAFRLVDLLATAFRAAGHQARE
jgi:arginase